MDGYDVNDLFCNQVDLIIEGGQIIPEPLHRGLPDRRPTRYPAGGQGGYRPFSVASPSAALDPEPPVKNPVITHRCGQSSAV